MSKLDTDNDQTGRIERIREIVREDYERIQQTSDPFVVLNLTHEAGDDEVRERYDRYERFYRAENFQRLGNMDLTRKALDVRRAIGRAMVQIQSQSDSNASTARATSPPDLPEVDPEAQAMGDIYFRDGLTYLRLSDFNAAREYFQRACEYDPSRGIILANLAYTRFKLDPSNEAIWQEAGRSLSQAAKMEPNNPEVFALVARFGINTRNKDMAHRGVERLESLSPNHPLLPSLKKRAKY